MLVFIKHGKAFPGLPYLQNGLGWKSEFNLLILKKFKDMNIEACWRSM